MASILKDKLSGRFRIRFRFGGLEFNRSMKVKDPREAEAVRGRVEETILMIERGRLTIPQGADTARFILSDGRITEKPKIEKVLTLAGLIDTYEKRFTQGAKKTNTLASERIHFRHLRRLIGPSAPASQIDTATLQEYVNQRANESYRGRRIKPQTIRKEVGTLQSVYSWAVHVKLIPTSLTLCEWPQQI